MRATLVEPRPRSRHPVVRLLRGLWTLPTNVLGHSLGALVSASRGTPVGSDAARGRLYRIRMPLVRRLAGVTLGHAILLSPELADGPTGRLVLAHELAHTRQHDVLGPLYLPLHGAAQLTSALLWLVAPVQDSDPVHAHNPLEQRWLCLGHAAIGELAHGERLDREALERYLSRLGA